MSIDSEVTSMTQNIQADYEGLENIGADLTGINKNILNIRTILDNIYNDLPKVTGEGTEVTLTPTRKGRLALIPKGNSTQESTTGKQLFNKNGTPISDYTIVDVIELNTGIRTELRENSSTGQYKYAIYRLIDLTNYVGKIVRVKANVQKSNSNLKSLYALGICDVNGANRTQKTSSDYDASGITETFLVSDLTETIKYLYIVLYANAGGSGSQGDYIDYTDLIVTIDNEDMSYEDFTGNLPAPNPSYPFPIKSVTGNNNIVVHNKNLFDLGTYYNGFCGITSGGAWNIGVGVSYAFETAKLPDTVVVNIEGGNRSNVSYWNELPTANGQIADNYDPNNYTTIPRSFSVNKNYKYIMIQVAYNVQLSSLSNGQLEAGTTLSEYIAPASQTKPLNLGSIELNKIGDYQDYIYKNNGKWYKKEVIGKVVLNGSESWNIYGTGTENWFYRLSRSTDIKAQTSLQVMCNEYPVITIGTSDTNNGLYLLASYVRVRWGAEDTITNWKTWLSTHNIIAYYIKDTAQDIEITDTQLIEQLNEIEKMKSYNGTTIITSTNEGTCDIIIEASALKNAE